MIYYFAGDIWYVKHFASSLNCASSIWCGFKHAILLSTSTIWLRSSLFLILKSFYNKCLTNPLVFLKVGISMQLSSNFLLCILALCSSIFYLFFNLTYLLIFSMISFTYSIYKLAFSFSCESLLKDLLII